MRDDSDPSRRSKRTDNVAREAARLIETGRADSIKDAIHQAAENLKAGDVRSPSYLQVRKHAQAMSMQSLGDAGYQQRILNMWQWAEELMTAIEHGLDADTLLVGRASQGLLDAGVIINIRIYTNESNESVRDALVEYGYTEPTLETVDTKFGRMNRLQILDSEEGFQAVLMRVKRSLNIERKTCVFTDKPIASVTLEELRKQIAERTSSE